MEGLRQGEIGEGKGMDGVRGKRWRTEKYGGRKESKAQGGNDD